MLLGEALRWQSQVHREGVGGEEHGPRPAIISRHLSKKRAQGADKYICVTPRHR